MADTILLLLFVLILLYIINKRPRSRTFISMTSDNNHLPYIHKTVNSLLNANSLPHRIILNIPNGDNIEIPSNINNKRVIINRYNNNNMTPPINDKYKFGIRDGDNIMTTSDKIDYPPSFLKNMLVHQQRNQNKAIINKSICKECPSVLFKTLSVHNVSSELPEEEDNYVIPEPIQEENNPVSEYDYNTPIITNNINNVSNRPGYNEMPYDNLNEGDLYRENNVSQIYDNNDMTSNEPAETPGQFNDFIGLPPIPTLGKTDTRKRLINGNPMYPKSKCIQAKNTCNYTKNLFYNRFNKIDFIPEQKKFTIVKRYLDYNNIEGFTI